DARGRYIEFAKSSIRNHSLKGLKVVLDCANGAAYSIAPLILKELGAEVIETAVHPDGLNINLNCGATCISHVSGLVKQHGAHLGISLDGDADRCIFCDADGNEVNGDKIIALCALDLKARKQLAENTVVVTSMSNLGLHKTMKDAGIKVEETDVGDRYVIERMQNGGFNIGGEQSGHIIFMDYATTGDGIITSLHVLKTMLDRNKTLAELANVMEEYPQVLKSVKVKEKIPVEKLPELSAEIKACKKALDGFGRTIVRYSGTENKIRILVEAKDASAVDKWVERLSAAVQKELC
ncbi:MAG: phosphohexomutase domain-containing protein, partial [Victivallaceae bacterium]